MSTCLFKTRNNHDNVRSRLDWEISFFISTPFPPPPPYRRPSYVVFVISTIEDCIQKVENEQLVKRSKHYALGDHFTEKPVLDGQPRDLCWCLLVRGAHLTQVSLSEFSWPFALITVCSDIVKRKFLRKSRYTSVFLRSTYSVTKIRPLYQVAA